MDESELAEIREELAALSEDELRERVYEGIKEADGAASNLAAQMGGPQSMLPRRYLENIVSVLKRGR